MPRYYDVLYDFGTKMGSGNPGEATNKDTSPDLISANPYALIAVWRHRFPVSFDRSKQKSFSNDVNQAVELRDQPLIIVEDIVHLNISNSKSSHIGQMNAEFKISMNYLTEMFPGDWVAAWIVYDIDKLKALIDRIFNTQQPCNRFYDGLKFFGKVTGVRKRIYNQPTGRIDAAYTINCASFTELDANLYYEPYLASNSVGIATETLRKTGITINDLIQNNGQGIDVNNAIPKLFDVFFGKGVPKDLGIVNNPANAQITAGPDNPDAFVIPDAVASIFGSITSSKPNGKKGWIDIMEILQGIQNYKLTNQSSNQDILKPHKDTIDYNPGTSAGSIFAPDGVATDPFTRKRNTGLDMMGTFLPAPPQFDGQRTIWSIFQQYLNPAVNEMYTCLRVNPQGEVYPTLVVRQLPFSSGVLSDTYSPIAQKAYDELESQVQKDLERLTKTGQKAQIENAKKQQEELFKNRGPRQLKITRFMELPRWLIDPILIKAVDFGRSDALRFNFIHVYPETGLSNQNRTGYIVRNPPIRDDLDIARSGLRPYMLSVNCAPADADNLKAGDWMYLLSDILMGQHLTLTGTMETVGIMSPICPGDNIEFDSTVFHIEGVSHTFAISPEGYKTFHTTLGLTHGMKLTQADGGDLSLYSGTSSKDLTRFEPSLTDETILSPSAPSEPEQGDDPSPIKPSGIDDAEMLNDPTKDDGR